MEHHPEKVLLVSYEYPPHGGGAGVVAQDNCRLLAEHFDFTLVTLDLPRIDKDNFSIELAKTYWPFRFIGFWKKLKSINFQSFDKIILNDIGACLVASLFFSNKLQRKCFVYLHGSEPENIYLRPELMYRLLRFRSKYSKLLEECKGVVAVSEYMREKFIVKTQLPQLKNKIYVVSNGVDGNIFRPVKVDLHSKHGIPKERKILLTVGRLTSQKGYARKLRIFKDLIKIQPSFWIVIGAGPYLDEFQSTIKNENLENFVLVINGMSRNKLVEYYSGADLFWLLSEYEESFGLVYLEANFCGCPVIANSKGGIPFIVELNQNGLLVNELDDIDALKIVKHALEKDSFKRSNVRDTVRKYSLHYSQQDLLELLNRKAF